MHITCYSECAPKDRRSWERDIRGTLLGNNQNLVVAFVYSQNDTLETLKKKKSKLLLIATPNGNDASVLRKTVTKRFNGSSPKMLKLGGLPVEGVTTIKKVEEILQYA